MRPTLLVVAALAAVGVVSPAATREDSLAKELGNRIPGKPRDCVDKTFVGGPDIVDERTILYRESGRRIWRNDLPDACRGMRPLDTIVIELYGSQMCENDRFRAFSPGSRIPGAFCRLGKFTPYDSPPKVKAK
jgi:hypothetical protein